MGRVRLILVLLTFLLISSNLFAQAYSAPESMVYDAVNDRYLTTNVGDWNTGLGGGEIIARANDGTLSYFAQGPATTLLGITIHGSFVYSAGEDANENQGVYVYSLLNDQFVETFAIAGGVRVNDICVGPNGFLYVTDGANIYKVNSDGGAVELFTDQLDNSNGIVYDPVNDRLLITNELNGEGHIFASDMTGTTLTDLVTVPGQWLDGIQYDNDGNWYVGSWETQIIYKYPPTLDGVPVDFVTGINGGADFFFNPIANELAIPLMDDNDVMFFPVGPPVGVEDEGIIPIEFSLQQNYPNPFNPATVISYSIPEQGLVQLKVYNCLGKEIATLENGIKNAGTHQLNFDASGLSTGIYFYTIKVDNFVQTKKMLMLK